MSLKSYYDFDVKEARRITRAEKRRIDRGARKAGIAPQRGRRGRSVTSAGSRVSTGNARRG